MSSLLKEFAGLAFDAQQVIMLRSMRLALGGRPAEREARLMVTEKLEAAGYAAVALMSGKPVDHIVKSYRRRVRANSRRLSKG